MSLFGDNVPDAILSYFSEDAYFWQPERTAVSEGEPVRLFFKFANGTPYSVPLLTELADRLVNSCVNVEATHAVPITIAPSEEEAIATVIFTEDTREGDVGVSYGLWLRDRQDLVGVGWFSLQQWID